MEPSVEEAFSFLDLEDCDAEDRNYLHEILGRKRGSPIAFTTGSSDAFDSNPLVAGGSATVDQQTRINIQNATLINSSEARECEAYQSVDKTFLGTEDTRGGNNLDDRRISTNSISTVSGTPNISLPSNTNPIILTPSRGSVREHQMVYQGNSQTQQQPVKVKPIQKTPASSAVSNYLVEPSQVNLNQVVGSSLPGAPATNIASTAHPSPSAHAIQQQHQAYAAAAAAAANVQHQHVANHQTPPYVFINQVTANVNVHHGPAPSSNQQHSGGTKDTANNTGLPTIPMPTAGSGHQLHTQQSQGITIPANHQIVPGSQSIPSSHQGAIHPSMHMTNSQLGPLPTSGLLSHSMSQPPPLPASVITTLAATGITPHPPGTASMHPMMANAFQLPPQMAAGPIPYGIPSRSSAGPTQQQPTIPPTMMPMPHLQQPYGYYPIFLPPNVAPQVPPYAAAALHGTPGAPQPQMAQVQQAHAAQVAMAQVQQAQVNIQQTAHRQSIPPPPMQSHPAMIRNALPASAAIPQGVNAPSGVTISQAHQKIAAADFTTRQRSPVQPMPSGSSSLGVTSPSQPPVPHYVAQSIIPSNNLPIQQQSSHQQQYQDSQQVANSSNVLTVVVYQPQISPS